MSKGDFVKHPKMQHCDFCGEELGVFTREFWGEPYTCGAAECERDARDDARAARDDARQAAEEDDFNRYRGGW